jgi:hypothetical protein
MKQTWQSNYNLPLLASFHSRASSTMTIVLFKFWHLKLTFLDPVRNHTYYKCHFMYSQLRIHACFLLLYLINEIKHLQLNENIPSLQITLKAYDKNSNNQPAICLDTCELFIERTSAIWSTKIVNLYPNRFNAWMYIWSA